MKVDSVVGNVETNMQGKSFRIQLTRESFKNMVGAIYSNPIAAIIRELACNAYDSHVLAGFPDKPFSIHIPTFFEPYFEIEDYGVGLDDNEVENIYTVLYNSTKKNSDAQIGCFGIGAKSPFVYSDNFTVTAIKNGICRVYSMYISSDGEPSYSLMGETSTDKPNGVKVNIAVEQADIPTFKNSATNILTYFPVKPICNLNLEYQNYTTEMSGEITVDGKTIKYECGGGRKSGYIMGNILYHEALQIEHLHIHVPIGCLQIPMSRETILVCDANKNFTVKVIAGIKEDIRRQLSENLLKCKNYVEAVFALSGISSRYLSLCSPLLWNNQPVSHTIHYQINKEPFEDLSSNLSNSGKFKKTSNLIISKLHKYLINDLDSDKKLARVRKKVSCDGSHIVFIFNKPDMKYFDELGLTAHMVKASTVQLDKIVRKTSVKISVLGYSGFRGETINGELEGILVKKGDYASRHSIRYLNNFISFVKNVYNKEVKIYGCYANNFNKLLKECKKLSSLESYINSIYVNDVEFQAQLKEYKKCKYNYNNCDYIETILKIDKNILNLGENLSKYNKLENDSKFSLKITMFKKSVGYQSSEEFIKKYPIIKYLNPYKIQNQEDKKYIRELMGM